MGLEGNAHGHREVGSTPQQSLMLETQFTPRVGARRGEMKTERKQGDIEREHFHMHSLQLRLLLPCGPVQT